MCLPNPAVAGFFYGMTLDQQRCDAIQQALAQRNWPVVFAGLRQWMAHYHQELSLLPSRQRARRPLLWRCLADAAEASAEQRLLEQLWQELDRLPPPAAPAGRIPLLGVPILNGPELLERLLASLDQQVHTLAIVDNSSGDAAVQICLNRLERQGYPGVERVRVARPFGNQGVAASWNQILTSFPELPWALIVNHDVVFAPGVLAQLLAVVDPGQPQWLPLLPGTAAYSAFVLTALAWDRVGLFDEGFYPAYWEDTDYRNRLDADPAVQQLETGPWLAAMAAANPSGSATLAADPALAEANRSSFQLNRLWYFSRRRLVGDRRGSWRRRWLASWN